MADENEDKFSPTKDISSEGIKVLTNLLDLAMKNEMIKSSDVKRILTVLKTNPSMRLSRIAKRLQSIKSMVAEIQSYDRRLDIVLDNCQEELNTIQKVSEMLPNYDKTDKEY
tara:strand:- start:2554 stop:2889 length:336 start_codon:yes stop_codon:yes gene_type:complete